VDAPPPFLTEAARSPPCECGREGYDAQKAEFDIHRPPIDDDHGHRETHDDERPVIHASRARMTASTLGAEHGEGAGDDCDNACRNVQRDESEKPRGTRGQRNSGDHDSVIHRFPASECQAAF